MTLSEFNKLTPSEQDSFIDSGATISPELPPPPLVQGKAEEVLGEELKVKEETTPLASSQSASSHSVGEPSANNFSEVGIDIEDPVELLFLLDDDIASGKVKLHKWQIQFLLDFARGGETDKFPFQAIVRAANGSGKDKYIIAPCVVWLCMRYKKARAVVTSSSGVQLDNQTCAYIDMLCKAANNKFGEIWKTNYRYYECFATESPIVCFATDEPGKAEGYHPLAFGAKMVLMESEAKTVPDEIHNAMSRCTGYTHRCLVSTPGNIIGHFHDLDSTAISRKELTDIIKDIQPTDYIRYHVTAFDCEHIPRSSIELAKKNLPGGEFGSAYKSQVLAEFGTTDEMVVIPNIHVYRCIERTGKPLHTKHIRETYNRGGLDLSDGGDETVLIVRNGNKLLKVIPFRFDNTEDTVAFLVDCFKENGLDHPDAIINADCGGLGKPILDRMYRMGWTNIRYKDNRATPRYPKTYKNFGAESWFHVRRLFEQKELILFEDVVLVRQLSSRYYKMLGGSVHQLLSKLEQRSRGYPSPDRADAFVLAFCDYKSTFEEPNFLNDPSGNREKMPFELPDKEQEKVGFTVREFAGRGSRKAFDKDRYYTSKGKDFSYLHEELRAYSETLTIKRK